MTPDLQVSLQAPLRPPFGPFEAVPFFSEQGDRENKNHFFGKSA